MSRKRKRSQAEHLQTRGCPAKGPSGGGSFQAPEPVGHPTLRLYYSQISSLRRYLQSRLQSSVAKAKIRRLTSMENNAYKPFVPNGVRQTVQDAKNDSDSLLGSLLSNTIVCCQHASTFIEAAAVEEDFAAFSQESLSTKRSSIEGGTVSQTEVSEYLWILHVQAIDHSLCLILSFSFSV